MWHSSAPDSGCVGCGRCGWSTSMGKRTTKSKDFVKVLWSIRHGHDVPTNYRGKIRVGRRQTTLMHALCGLDPACSQEDWRVPTLRSLEAAGADIDAKDSDGQTPLEDAVGSLVHGIDDGMELAIQTLLELGAKVPDDLFFLPYVDDAVRRLDVRDHHRRGAAEGDGAVLGDVDAHVLPVQRLEAVDAREVRGGVDAWDDVVQ